MKTKSASCTVAGNHRHSIHQAVGTLFPYFLLLAGAIGLIASIWLVLDKRIRSEERTIAERAFHRSETAVNGFESFALRTLQAADNIMRMAVVSISHTSHEEMIRRATQTGIIDGHVFHSLNVMDSNGNLIASTLGQTRPMNYADRGYFKEARRSNSDQIMIGAPISSRLTDEAVIPVIKRLSNPLDGSFAGVVLLQIKANAFVDGYNNLRLQEKDYVALIGTDGVVRAGRLGRHQMAGLNIASSNVLARQKDTPNGKFLAQAMTDKAVRYVVYRTLANYPLIVASGSDYTLSAKELSKYKEELDAVGVVSSLLVALFAFALGVVLFKKDQANNKLTRSEARLKVLATSDSLTDLPNRSALEKTAIQLLREAEESELEVTFVFIDLDNFGDINAAFGHPAGDRVLKAVADAIAPVAAIGHIARIGGDEFLAIFRSEKQAEAHALRVANEIREKIEGVQTVDGHRVDLRGSYGISIYPKHASSFPELIRCADAAMAISKMERRGVPHLFSSEIHISIAKRLEMRTELAQAIHKKELEVFYQPKLDLVSKRPIGIEALVRWRHPVRGLVAPNVFIPVAEDSGLIIQIGAWVLNQACRDCKRLNWAGYTGLPVAVNVSTLQFKQPDFIDSVRNALKDTGLPPSLLELEVTESMISDQPEMIIGRMDSLKKIGVSIALDDFGTGYSNLVYLHRFPLDVLKIDRSFVAEVPESSQASSIVLAIIGLAKSLKLKVVAEGVETFAHQEFLMANGCDYAQGYLYGKPMPFEDLKVWLGSRLKPQNVIVAFPTEAREQ